MNGSLIGRIVWKEYRQQRSLLLSVIGLSMFAQITVLFVSFVIGEQVSVDGLYVMGPGMSMLYALGCGALLFAGEDEAGTIAFLRSHPVSSGEVFVGKVGFAVASTLLLLPTLWLSTLAISRGMLPEPESHSWIWLISAVGSLELLAWSVLCSLLVSRVLWATLVAGSSAATFASYWLIIAEDSRFMEHDLTFVRSASLHGALMFAVILAVVYVGRRWLDESPVIARMVQRATAVKPRVRGEAHAAPPTPLAACCRLLWQGRRQSIVARRLLLAVAILTSGTALVSATVASNRTVAADRHPLLLLVPVFAALLGTCVFAGDQRQFGFRFLCQRGVSPRMIWLTRQLYWSGWLAVAVAMLVLVSMAQPSLMSNWLTYSTVQAILFYAVGQACSLFVRSSLLAIAATAAGCIAAAAWHLLMRYAGISVVATVLPIPLVLLFATWLRAPDWVTENATWRARLRAIGSIAIPSVVLLISIATYRATEIPKIALPYDRVSIERAPTEAERQTADLYRMAFRRFQAAAQPHAELSDAAREEAVRNFLAATRKPACRFSTHGDTRGESQAKLGLLSREISAIAAGMEDEGQLDAALELYWALLRLAEQLYAQPSLVHYVQGFEIETTVLERLPRWAARPGQSSQRVLEVQRELETHLRRLQPNWSLAIGGDYDLYRRMIELDEQSVGHRYGRDAAKIRYLAWLLGWEQTRLVRLLDMMAAAEIARTSRQWELLTHGGELSRPNIDRRDVEIETWRATTPLISDFGPSRPAALIHELADHESRRRVARIQLALVAWQIDHHKLPESLDALVNHGLAGIVSDPFSGLPVRYAPDGGYRLDQQTKVFQPGGPCLWIAGSKLQMVDPNREPFHLKFSYANRVLQSDNDLWQHGVRFPIPLVTPDGGR